MRQQDIIKEQSLCETNTVLGLLVEALEITESAYDIALKLPENPASDDLTSELGQILARLESLGLALGVNVIKEQGGLS